MTAHTAGTWKWFVSSDGQYRCLDSDQGDGEFTPVLIEVRKTACESEADLALIAAAPDLLAACKAMLKADGDNRYSAREFVEAKEMMAAAVDKAEGRP
jgi:hypothetical protein